MLNAALAALLLVAFCWALLKSRGPTLAGQSVQGWKRRLVARDETAFGKLGKLLREMDTNALPFLTVAMTERPSALDQIRLWARSHARRLGISSAPVPVRRDFGETMFRRAVITALQHLGTNGLPALRHVLKYGSNERVIDALSILEPLGPKARAARPELINLLKRPDPSVRRRTIDVIQAAEITDDIVLASLVPVLSDLPGNTIAAGRILQSAHYRDELAVQHLLPLMRGKVDSEVWDAAKLLEAYGPQHPGIVEEFIELLRHPLAGFRGKAAATLGSFGKSATMAEPQLRVLVNDEWEDVRRAARDALRKLNERSETDAQ
jgi:HEAT repeat protein